MKFSIQPHLETQRVILEPLKETDLEALYAAASDPEIWQQHPNKQRWKPAVFKTFFEGALQSKGAFKITDKASGKVIGSTRYYDYEPLDNSLFIGYTFYARDYWGKGINAEVKKEMLDYIFQYVAKVYLHIGAENLRSQISIQRLGAEKIGEAEVQYFGEDPRHNFVYVFTREQWQNKTAQVKA